MKARGVGFLELKLQEVVSHSRWVLGIELRALEEQTALLTTEPPREPATSY